LRNQCFSLFLSFPYVFGASCNALSKANPKLTVHFFLRRFHLLQQRHRLQRLHPFFVLLRRQRRKVSDRLIDGVERDEQVRNRAWASKDGHPLVVAGHLWAPFLSLLSTARVRRPYEGYEFTTDRQTMTNAIELVMTDYPKASSFTMEAIGLPIEM
jgi:hypothetical protein